MKNLKVIKIYNCNFHLFIENEKVNAFISLAKKIPEKMYSNCTDIYIQPSEYLDDKGLDAISNKNIIKIDSSKISSDKDFIKTLIHELYHLYHTDLKQNNSESYKNVCDEYLDKKKIVLDKLKNDQRFYPPKDVYYSKLDYSRDFDNYLYNIIGYDNLYIRIIDIFPNAYSMTSVDEYIAICFEIFFFENQKWLSMYSPEVYNFIKGM